MVEAAYDAGPIRRGDLLYYAHLKARSGLNPGAPVEAGEKIGEVGSTGQGPDGTQGRFKPHLHLDWYQGSWLGNDRAASGAMNPYPLLRWLGGDAGTLRPASLLVQTGGYRTSLGGDVITAGGGRENDTGRIEAFSDGVFAIAITLLIIEIGVPHVGELGSLFGELLHLWPSYLGYAISFLVIGTVWANHHNRFRLISCSDHILLFVNILFLMCVAFLPFPTALLAEYIRDEAHRTTAVAVYSGTLAVTAVFFTLLWLYAAANYRLIDQSVDPVLLRAMTRRYVLGMLLYIVAFALAFVSPAASLVLIVILALIFVLPEPDGSNSARQHFFEG